VATGLSPRDGVLVVVIVGGIRTFRVGNIVGDELSKTFAEGLIVTCNTGSSNSSEMVGVFEIFEIEGDSGIETFDDV